jgi:integrase
MKFTHLGYEEIKTRLATVPDMQDKALFAALYGSAARAGEIVGVCKESIETDANGFLIIKMITEKNRSHPERRVPIDPETEAWIVEPIRFWLGVCGTPALWKQSTRNIQYKCHKYFGCHPHALRHSRLTHFVERFNLNDSVLRQLAGWTDTRPSSIYVHLDYTAAAAQMLAQRKKGAG